MRIVTALLFGSCLLVQAACTKPPALTEHVYPAWGFAAAFRDPPKETDMPASADGTQRHTFLVESAAADRDNLVVVIDGSGSSKSDDQALADAPATLASSAGGTLGPITYVATGAVVGREFSITRPGKPASRVRVFVARQHLYEVIAGPDHGPDDPEITRFLDSFRLTAG